MNNKLLFIIALSFSVLVNIPRISFLFINEDTAPFIRLLNVTVKSTLFTSFSIFTFSFLLLKLNTQWYKQWFDENKRQLKTIITTFFFFVIWVWLFKKTNQYFSIEIRTIFGGRLVTYVYFFIMLMLLVISWALRVNNEAKQAIIEKSELEQQSLINELAALKNQVNPHFLFNSFNSLSFLVREDQKAAGKFINKLSYLYRYILQSKDHDLVTVKEELKFLESYIFLIEQRYQDNFKTNINLPITVLDKKIPALAIQLLVENAVKHNEISVANPLELILVEENNFLVVTNNLQKRSGNIESTYVGLSNLNKRFLLLSKKEISIEQTTDFFIVKLPLL